MVQKRWVVFAGTVIAVGFLYLIAGASSLLLPADALPAPPLVAPSQVDVLGSIKLLLYGVINTAVGILMLREELRHAKERAGENDKILV